MHRRKFIKNAGITTAGITILNFPVFGKKAPSNKVIVAVSGVNSRGAYLAKSYASLPDVEVAYICDVEEKAIKNGLDALKDASRKPAVVKDIRKLVTQNDFDALIIAMPDHWHTPAAILGVSHGKHVYVEKPCGHNPHEGELLIQAFKKYGKQMQMGNQRRSFPNTNVLIKEVHNGLLGHVYFGKAWYTNDRKSIGFGKKIPVPSTLDFELWQGPAPRKDYQDNLVHYNWHWFWHWGTGESCNNGTHEVDSCRWFLGVDYPTKVTSAGGRYAFKDDWQTPDTQVASFEFGDKASISWESRSCNNNPVEGAGRGFIIYGDKGTLVNSGSDEYKIFDTENKLVKEMSSDVKPDPNNPVTANGNLDLFHFDNFIKSVKGEASVNSPMTASREVCVRLCIASSARLRSVMSRPIAWISFTRPSGSVTAWWDQ